MRRNPRLGRRQFLGAAGLAGLGLGSLPARASATGPSSMPATRIRSCILIFYYGGPSHLDTLDPKPDAPAEIRGDYRTIATSVPGVRICEHLPRTARLLDRVALVRSLHHPMRNHNSAAAEALTGRTPAGGDQELLTDDPRGLPTLGSAVSYALGRAFVTTACYTLYNVCNCRGRRDCSAAYDRLVEGDERSEFRVAFDGHPTWAAGGPAAPARPCPALGVAGRSEAYRDGAQLVMPRSADCSASPANRAARAIRPASARPSFPGRRLVEVASALMRHDGQTSGGTQLG